VESAARELLADPSDDVKALAAAALARIGSHDLPQLLAPFVHSAHPRLASIALKVIAQASFDRYLRSFDRLDEATRQAAARAIAKIDASLLDRLHGELAALEPDRRLKALRIAGYAGAGDRLRPFLREVLADPDVKVRATAVKMLGILGGADGLHALIEALNDPDRRIRANAVEAFEEIGDTRFVMLLKPFLADPDNRVRANAAKALHRLGVSEGRETLEQMLESEERLMRLSAAWAMGEIGARAFEAPLRARLPREQDSQVRERIRRALESLEQSDA
jgi:HEAT repeat protein